jgi:universal stress protein E
MTHVNELHPRTVRFAERAKGHDAIEKILVVVDPTALRHPCIEKATRLAAGFGSTVELYVCDVDQSVPESWAGGSTLAQYRSVLRERRLGMLEELAAPMRADGIHVIVESEWHAPLEDAVIRRAIHTRADLVIKDTHRHPLTAHMPSVQTDWNLIRQLPMPLLLVRPGAWGAHPAIAASVDPFHVAERPVALDQSLLDLACSLRRALSGNLAAFHVLQPTPHLPGEPVSAATQAATFECQRTAVNDLVQGRSVGACETGFIEAPVPEGIVQLVQRSHPAILLMGVAARERLPIGAVSTASQVLEQTDCDLLVVKPSGFVSPALVTS